MRQTYERDPCRVKLGHAEMIGCQSRVQRGGRNLHQIRRFGPKQRGPDRPLGIKFREHRPVERELADIALGRLGRGLAAGRGWSCSRRSEPPRSVTTSRSIWPETSAGGCPGRSSRPTIETSARLPGANTGANRGSAIRANAPSASDAPLVLGPAVGIAGEIATARPRGGVRLRYRAAIAAAGAPARRAAARGRAARWIRRCAPDGRHRRRDRTAATGCPPGRSGVRRRPQP